MSDDIEKMENKTSWADTVQEEENEIRRGELSGSMEGIHAGNITSKILERQHSEQKQKVKEQSTKAALSIAEQAYHDLMNKFAEDKKRIEDAMRDLKRDMDENRKQWELVAQRLDDVDTLLGDVEAGKDLNVAKATEVIKKAGKDIPENASSADLLILLNTIKGEDRIALGNLDTEYGLQSTEYGNLEHDWEIVDQAEKAATKVAHSDLSDDEKEIEYGKINDEYGNANLLSGAMNAEEELQEEILAAADKEYDKELELASSSEFDSMDMGGW